MNSNYWILTQSIPSWPTNQTNEENFPPPSYLSLYTVCTPKTFNWLNFSPMQLRMLEYKHPINPSHCQCQGRKWVSKRMRCLIFHPDCTTMVGNQCWRWLGWWQADGHQGEGCTASASTIHKMIPLCHCPQGRTRLHFNQCKKVKIKYGEVETIFIILVEKFWSRSDRTLLDGGRGAASRKSEWWGLPRLSLSERWMDKARICWLRMQSTMQ